MKYLCTTNLSRNLVQKVLCALLHRGSVAECSGVDEHSNHAGLACLDRGHQQALSMRLVSELGRLQTLDGCAQCVVAATVGTLGNVVTVSG